MVEILTNCILPGFRTFIKGPVGVIDKINEFRDSLGLPFGTFVWERVVIHVDVAVTNALLEKGQFRTLQELFEAKQNFEELGNSLDIRMPFFTQATLFLTSYETIIQNNIPFPEVAPDLPMDFLLALVFTGKRERLIKLELSDRRILASAEEANVDVAAVEEIKLTFDESHTDIPLSVWFEK
jgi:hypothetical protein